MTRTIFCVSAQTEAPILVVSPPRERPISSAAPPRAPVAERWALQMVPSSSSLSTCSAATVPSNSRCQIPALHHRRNRFLTASLLPNKKSPQLAAGYWGSKAADRKHAASCGECIPKAIQIDTTDSAQKSKHYPLVIGDWSLANRTPVIDHPSAWDSSCVFIAQLSAAHLA